MTEHYKYVVHAKLTDPLMDIVNIYYVSFSAPFTPSVAQASAYVTSLYGGILPYLPATLNFDYLGVSHWTGDSTGIWYDEVNKKPLPNPPWGVELPVELSAIDGTGEGQFLPPQVAALVYGKTATKHVIARKFIGPLIESAQANGSIETAIMGDFIAFAESWKTWVQGAGGPAGTTEVWGYRRGFNTILTTHADSILATNRRRKPGRGS